MYTSFFGGLNGDGFFNEEYEGGSYEHGECGGSVPPPPVPLSRYKITVTETQTEKAVMLSKVFDCGNEVMFWMPKSAISGGGVETWALKMLLENIHKSAQSTPVQRRI